MGSYPTASARVAPKAIVMTDDGIFYDSGVRRPLTQGLDLSNLQSVLTGAATAFRGDEGVLVVDRTVESLTKRRRADPVSREVWHYTELRGWTTFVRKTDAAVVHLGCLPDLTTDGRLGPLMRGQEPDGMARRLGRYHTATGAPWRYTPGVSGCAALRARFTDPRPGRQPLWRVNLGDDARWLRGAGPLIWTSATPPPAADEGSVVLFDINAMYLSALKNCRLGWGQLVHSPGIMFDRKWPGYWELDTSKIPSRLIDGVYGPPVISKQRVHNGALVVTTPVAAFLTDAIGQTPDVLNAWVCENGHPVTRPYAERLAAARAGDLGPLGADVERAIKMTYAEMVGMMSRPGGSIERPDWAHTVMDLARVNMLRRLDRIQVPGQKWRILAVRTDGVYIHLPASVPNGREQLSDLLGVGVGPGMFKYVETMTVGQYWTKFAMVA